jgi:hypothetical protein
MLLLLPAEFASGRAGSKLCGKKKAKARKNLGYLTSANLNQGSLVEISSVNR